MVGPKLESRLLKFEREAMSHLDTLMRAAVRLLRNAHDAEEAVQETYLRAWKYFDSFETGSNCRAWLFRIMFNVINGRKGKRAKAQEVSLEEPGLEQQRGNVVVFDPNRALEGREVLEAASRLSEEHRSVLWLVVVEDFTYKEAADILEVPIGTVMSRLHRARKELRKALVRRTSGASP